MNNISSSMPALLVVVSVAAIAILSVSPNYAYAVSTFDIKDQSSCLSLPSGSPSWDSGTNTCTVTSISLTLNSGDSLTVENGITLAINSGTIAINSGGTINNLGTIKNNGQINNNSGGSINNSGSIYTSSSIVNQGTINNNSGGNITINNNNGIMFNNSGGIINNNSGGTITIFSSSNELDNDSTINNSGAIFLYGDSTINNNSDGTIINTGSINNNAGTINNFGTINNNAGTIHTGFFINSGGTVNNNSGGILHNVGYFENSGTINNSGSIANNDDLENFGTINNNSGGTIDNNSSTIKNNSGGIIINKGLINNTSRFFTNFGSIVNECGGSITGSPISGNPVTNICEISILSVSNISPRWGIDSVSVSGNLTNSQPGYTITLNWGDGTSTTGISISGTLWGSVAHIYGPGAIGTNPNQIIATLVNVTGHVEATSLPVSITVQKHSTILVHLDPSPNKLPYLRPIYLTSVLYDTSIGTPMTSKTITWNGSGITGTPTNITSAYGIALLTTNSKSPPATYNIQSRYAGDSLYNAAVSNVAKYISQRHDTKVLLWIPFNHTIGFTQAPFGATLMDTSFNGGYIVGQTVTFNGTGVPGVLSKVTNANGDAITFGPAPSTSGTWTVQGRFAGTSNYVPSNSIIKTYKTS